MISGIPIIAIIMFHIEVLTIITIITDIFLLLLLCEKFCSYRQRFRDPHAVAQRAVKSGTNMNKLRHKENGLGNLKPPQPYDMILVIRVRAIRNRLAML